MENQKVKMNQIIYNCNRASAQLFCKNTPTINKIISSGPIKNIRCVDPLPILVNGIEVQAEADCVYAQREDTMVLRIHFLNNDSLNDNTNYYIKPNINTSRIGCPTCLNYYSMGQTPCDCIKIAPNIYADEIIVESIDIITDDINLNNIKPNRSLLTLFFGGAISNITITDDTGLDNIDSKTSLSGAISQITTMELI